ncbi:MAG: hypothetical protein ABW166_19365 [Sedimenticola sp.]
MKIAKITDKLMLGDADEWDYSVRVKVKKLRCGEYSKDGYARIPYYRIDGVVDCVRGYEFEKYSANSIFVSKKNV